MEQLIELLKQIQDLAGVAIDALDGAGKGKGGDMPPEHEGGGAPPQGGKPPEGGGAPPPPQQ